MKTILLIEDDAILRENTAELLELSNYRVIKASNGKYGLLSAKQYLPDIIVCDIMMPELDGYQVLKELSKNEATINIPFIFLSAKTHHKDVRKGMNLGADDYITKPFNEEELICAIESRLAKASILKDIRDQSNQNTLKPSQEDEIATLQDLIHFFNKKGKPAYYAAGESIYLEGNNSNTIYLIKKGMVKCFKFDELGKELITGLYKEDDFFGYSSFIKNLPYQESATAIEDTALLGVSKQVLNSILENNHKVTLELMELLNTNLSGIKEQLLQMAYGSVTKKTAATILQFAKKMNKNIKDPIKISRSDLASVAGIATETFIRTMTIFKKEGLIEIEGRNIKVLDINKLEQMI